MSKKSIKVVTGVIGSDVHKVGNSIIETYLEQTENVEPVNIGVMASQKEFVDAAYEEGADAVWVSSLYGQGELDCKGLKESFTEYGLDDVLLYIGGNLSIGKTDYDEVVETYSELGFDGVYPVNTPGTNPKELPEKAYNDMLEDLGY